MTEVRPYLPFSTTYAELVRYGEDHDDAWVREMAKTVAEVCDVLNNTEYHRIDTLDELIDAYEEDLYDCKSAVGYAEEELDEAQDKQKEAEDKYEALRYDLDYSAQVKVINSLKAEVMECQTEKGEAHKRNHELSKTIGDLKKELAHVRDQLNMWTILNK